MSSQGLIPDYESNADNGSYKVGTLTYTKAGLIAVFGWMVWGTVVLTLVEAIFPVSMPLQLTRLNAPVASVAILMTALSQAINMIMVVPIGFRSDRTRTRWGRRIPYIFGSMPLLFFSLGALGFTDDIGRILNHAGWPARMHLSAITVTVLIVGVMVSTFDISNVFVGSMYDYLINDVIPQKALAKYMGASRVAGQLAGSIFNFFILGYIETHTRTLYVAAAILYVVGFGTLCFGVREGSYPPPHDYEKRQSVIASTKVFFRECFTHPLYLSMYVASGVWSANFACNSYRWIFYTKSVGFDLKDIGPVKGWLGLIAFLIAFPIGWFVDKIHPLRGFMLAVFLTTPFTFASFYMPNFSWFVWIAIFTLPMDIMIDCSEGPLRMHIFPRAQYGQFAAATSLLRSCTILICGMLGGVFIQLMVHLHGQRGYAYCFIWQGSVSTAALACLCVVYYYWRQYGDTSQIDAEELEAEHGGEPLPEAQVGPDVPAAP